MKRLTEGLKTIETTMANSKTQDICFNMVEQASYDIDYLTEHPDKGNAHLVDDVLQHAMKFARKYLIEEDITRAIQDGHDRYTNQQDKTVRVIKGETIGIK